MLRCLVILFLFVYPQLLHAQTLRLGAVIKDLPGDFSYMMPDEIGNLFALTSAGQLKKYNPVLDSMGVFNDVRRYGRLHSISSENPLRSILFFREFKTILILDRLMQVVNRIDLRKSGIFQTQAVAQSYDNKIWVFDEQESRIKKLDDDGSVIFSSADLRLVFAETIAPTVMFDKGGYLYLYDGKAGLFIFDYYGTLKNRIALLGWEQVQYMEKQIMGMKEGKLLVHTLNTLDIKTWTLPGDFEQFLQFRFTPKAVFALKKESITCYAWGK